MSIVARIAPFSLALTLVGCAGLFGEKKPESQNVELSVPVPKLSPLGDTREAQEKDGVSVSVATEPFALAPDDHKQYREVPSFFVVQGKKDYEVTTTPGFRVTPGNLRFQVRITNNTDQVLRLAGALVRFNIDGKEAPMDAETGDLRSFADAILAPREQRQFKLSGPRTAALPSPCNVGLFLYGVVTATDPAGNPTRRSNFEWVYRYQTDPEHRTAAVTVEKVSMDPREVPKE